MSSVSSQEVYARYYYYRLLVQWREGGPELHFRSMFGMDSQYRAHVDWPYLDLRPRVRPILPATVQTTTVKFVLPLGNR
jgi:hypothetical protein